MDISHVINHTNTYHAVLSGRTFSREVNHIECFPTGKPNLYNVNRMMLEPGNGKMHLSFARCEEMALLHEEAMEKMIFECCLNGLAYVQAPSFEDVAGKIWFILENGKANYFFDVEFRQKEPFKIDGYIDSPELYDQARIPGSRFHTFQLLPEIRMDLSVFDQVLSRYVGLSSWGKKFILN